MAEQSRLEQIGISKRESLVLKNRYDDEEFRKHDEYTASHKDALSDGDPLGKGTGKSMGYAVANESSFYVTKDGYRVQEMSYDNLQTHETDTQTIGGSYDRNGRPEVGSKSGRQGISTINFKYHEGKEYGVNSVDTKINVTQEGQFVIND